MAIPGFWLLCGEEWDNAVYSLIMQQIFATPLVVIMPLLDLPEFN